MRITQVLRAKRDIASGVRRGLVIDLLVYSFIFLLVGFQLTHYLHTADFVNDATYPDLAKSILEHRSYEIRFLPETTLPPGFALMLALIGRFWGLTPSVLFPVIAACMALGLLASYELLLCVEGRVVAVVACLIFGSSPAVFYLGTQVIYPELPYFLGTMLVLLLARKIARAAYTGVPLGWVVVLGLIISFTLLVRTVGIALLFGLAAWMIVSYLRVPSVGKRRIRIFLVPLVFGLAAQFEWSLWARNHETLEWQLPGYPQSYFSQLALKDGHYPELGMVRPVDILSRAGRNLVSRSAGFSRFVTRRNIANFWASPAIFGVLALIGIGLVSSLRDGGQLHDWYFLFYEFIFMVWPWDYRDRFLIPVVPLACLYLWRGAKTLENYSIRHPKSTGIALMMVGILLSLASSAFALNFAAFAHNPGHAKGDYLQTVVATLFWGTLALIGFGLFKSQAVKKLQDSPMMASLHRMAKASAPLVLRVVGITVVAVWVASGASQMLAIGRENRNPDITKEPGYPMIEAAEWIREHEPPNRVLMARDSEFVFHFARRRVVWFPPISDPKKLMDGILRNHVEVVLVVHHDVNYWLPAEDGCFQSLLQEYGSAFKLVHTGPDTRVYEVLAPPEAQRAR